jgi:hypothetical protein
LKVVPQSVLFLRKISFKFFKINQKELVMQRKVNDVGGLPSTPIDHEEHDPTFFEKRIDAMLMLLTSPKVHAFSVDALRRAVEENTADDYTKRGYYEKWLKAIRQLLIEQGILSEAEIIERIDAIKKRKS